MIKPYTFFLAYNQIVGHKTETLFNFSSNLALPYNNSSSIHIPVRKSVEYIFFFKTDKLL